VERKKSEVKVRPKRRQLGIHFDDALWFELRGLALRKRRTGTELLEEAAREYIKRHGQKGE